MDDESIEDEIDPRFSVGVGFLSTNFDNVGIFLPIAILCFMKPKRS